MDVLCSALALALALSDYACVCGGHHGRGYSGDHGRKRAATTLAPTAKAACWKQQEQEQEQEQGQQGEQNQDITLAVAEATLLSQGARMTSTAGSRAKAQPCRGLVFPLYRLTRGERCGVPAERPAGSGAGAGAGGIGRAGMWSLRAQRSAGKLPRVAARRPRGAAGPSGMAPAVGRALWRLEGRRSRRRIQEHPDPHARDVRHVRTRCMHETCARCERARDAVCTQVNAFP